MNDRDILVTLAAVLAVGAVFAIFLAGVIAPKPKKEDKQREQDLALAQKRLYDAMRADRSHMYDRRRYEAAVTYVSPEKIEQSKPTNVAPIRRARKA